VQIRRKGAVYTVNKTVQVIGVPFAAPYPKDASVRTDLVRHAPAALRERGVLRALQAAGLRVIDAGDLQLPFNPQANSLTDIESSLTQIETGLDLVLSKASRILIIGGTCMIAAGTVPALRHRFAQAHLLWIDGHADFATEASTTSHYLGGMALSTVVGANKRAAVIAPAHVTLLGGAGADWNEIVRLKRYGVRHVYPDEVVRFAENELPDRDLLVHLDLDALAASIMPAVDLTVLPGFSRQQLARVLRAIARSGRLRSLELTSYNPTKDPDGTAVATLISILREEVFHHVAPVLQ